jgi:hypothetical protein
LLSRIACWKARAVSSQPPPGSAGAMIEIRSLGYSASSESPPAVLPHAPSEIAETAAAQTTAARRMV